MSDYQSALPSSSDDSSVTGQTVKQSLSSMNPPMYLQHEGSVHQHFVTGDVGSGNATVITPKKRADIQRWKLKRQPSTEQNNENTMFSAGFKDTTRKDEMNPIDLENWDESAAERKSTRERRVQIEPLLLEHEPRSRRELNISYKEHTCVQKGPDWFINQIKFHLTRTVKLQTK
ncbi:hypothetical protein GBF38_002767 [Nibea albiflora]|uniref:Uncharacterized protein n=1 Tax=Nibea albiflora TaxID=240163 RepID=A0ACB7EDV4_NIBAL|nr:hypothetical protein GBF38_002767 [Nibea albiflora]